MPINNNVKAGDRVKVRGYDFCVAAVTPFGVLGCWAAEMVTPREELVGADVTIQPWRDVILPDPPKAKPGVRYRRDMAMSALGYVDQAVGLANGRVLAHALNGDYASVELDFNDSWREVPE